MIAQITEGIEHVSATAQVNAASSVETAEAGHRLTSQAQSLHTLVSGFRLKGE